MERDKVMFVLSLFRQNSKLYYYDIKGYIVKTDSGMIITRSAAPRWREIGDEVYLVKFSNKL